MITKPEDILPLIEAGNPVTEQQAFEAISFHLFRQGRPAYQDETCVYRGHGDLAGLKCAGGALIPNSLYRDWMDAEPTPFDGVMYTLSVSDELWKSLNPLVELICKLQSIHDRDSNRTDLWMEYLPERLQGVGLNYGLNVEFLEELDFPPD